MKEARHLQNTRSVACILLVLGVTTGCEHLLPLDSRPCPCAAGYTCDEAHDTCVLHLSIDDPAIDMLEYDSDGVLPNELSVPDATGALTTVSSLSQIDLANPFFRDLGTNGRRCVTCHLPTAGWSLTPDQLRRVFDATAGGQVADPLGLAAVFRPVDGANSPDADVSTLDKRRTAYSMLLTRGVIRVGLPMPPVSEFVLADVDDPYGHAGAADLSLFRRPLPTTNLRLLSTIMWDGREVSAGKTLSELLQQQASDANVMYAQGDPLDAPTAAAIVELALTLHTAQSRDTDLGPLDAAEARGGPHPLSDQVFYIGINDVFGDSATHAPFTPYVFDLYDAWSAAEDSAPRQAVARGQALFNTRTFQVSGVSGLNDEASFGTPTTLTVTCSFCHNAPNAGSHSVTALFDIGIASGARRAADLPLYTLRSKLSDETRQTTDPGRALITGKWKDIGRFKVPGLRGLAGRAPYFHNGTATDLTEVVSFYDARFELHLSAQDKSDLVAFLRVL